MPRHSGDYDLPRLQSLEESLLERRLGALHRLSLFPRWADLHVGLREHHEGGQRRRVARFD